MDHSCVELEHEHGAENNPDLRYSSGNDEPHRGFGHLAFLTGDVYKASEELETAGVSFKKKPGDKMTPSMYVQQRLLTVLLLKTYLTLLPSSLCPKTWVHL